MRTPQNLLVGCLLLSVAGAFSQDTIERKPLVIGTKIETGQIVQGSQVSGEVGDPDDNYLSQIGVSLTQEVVVNRRLNIRVGVGGVFYSVFPAEPNPFGNALGTKFGPGITQAQAHYKFGDADRSWGGLRIGYFPYKYNPDAKNLGEYLFRAGAYPTFAFTGGWSITDNASIRAQGIEFSLTNCAVLCLDGDLKHSFLLANERDFRPVGDFTPSYVAEYTKGPIQVGGGVAFYHWFPIKGSRTNPRDENTAYYTFDNLPAYAIVSDATGDTVMNVAANRRTVASTGDVAIIASALGHNWSSVAVVDSMAARYNMSTGYYETKAVKLMGRASFSIQKLFPMDFLNPNDLKVYGEVALLGVKDYPGMYEKLTERMPIMGGINLPTFKLLDVLSVEVEYFRNSNPDDIGVLQLYQYPSYHGNTPYTGNLTSTLNGLPNRYDDNVPNPSYSILLRDANANRRDDWKWSVYAMKQVIAGVSLRAQVANDHFRKQDANAQGNWTGPSMLRTPKDWYYIVSVNFGI
jgi:hypothetical protein